MTTYRAVCPVIRQEVRCDSIIRLRERISRAMIKNGMSGTVRFYNGSKPVGSMHVHKDGSMTYTATTARKPKTRDLDRNGRIHY